MDELKNYAINQNRRENVCKNNDYSREKYNLPGTNIIMGRVNLLNIVM